MSVKEPELSLSFVDLLSCSLGAMILLFLIFATMSHDGSEDSQNDTGVPLELNEAGTAKADTIQPNAPQLFEVVLESNGGTAIPTLVAHDGSQSVQPLKVEFKNHVSGSRFLIWVPVDQQKESIKFQVTPSSQTAIEVYRLTAPHEQPARSVMPKTKLTPKDGQPAIEVMNGKWQPSSSN